MGFEKDVMKITLNIFQKLKGDKVQLVRDKDKQTESI